MYAYEFEGTRYDAGDKFGYLIAIMAYGLRHSEIGEDDFKKYLKEAVTSL